jgi:hypothetical protein
MYAESSMLVPLPKRLRCDGAWRRFLYLLPLAAAFAAPLQTLAFEPSHQAPPEARFSLEDLGFPGTSPNFLNAGVSLLTVHFADSEHLLVTFSLRCLVPRLPGDPPDHDDRMVAALLVELPSGKVLARTEWHLHDHGRYLWNLGGGRFLLREGNALWTFTPMVNLKSGQPFVRRPFPHRSGQVEAVVVSPDNRLVTVETKAAKNSGATTVSLGDASSPSMVALDFYRIAGGGADGSPLASSVVGSARSASTINLPMSADGYLRSNDMGQGTRWSVAFEPFGGKTIKLAPIDSSCPPGLRLVSPTQLVALSCRGSVDRTILMAFDFNSHEMWQEPLDSFTVQPVFAFAPAAGRFAVSRTNASVATDILTTDQDNVQSQEVRVYQTQTGDLLLKVNCSPVLRTSENFDLSADGMKAVVVRKGAIEVYRLPELSAGDRADLAELQKAAPPSREGPVDLSGLAVAETKEAVPEEEVVAGPLAVNTEEAAVPEAPVVKEGAVPRKPPTLLNPGEKAEFVDKSPR